MFQCLRRLAVRMLVSCCVLCSMFFVAAPLPANPPQDSADQPQDIAESDPKAAAAKEASLLNNVRQLTFEGRRAGEGYFSRDGGKLVFQSEREKGNPFFQIYLMDLETGDVERVSPGSGKTTCAWIHPTGEKVLFASTHDDKQARQKQDEEIKLRESGHERRYSWDYDETFDIYQWDRDTREYTNLTNTRGYDAEGSWSPDGRLIAFGSNRRAYTDEMSDEERKMFEHDPSYMMDIYIMNADGTNVRQLTDVPGYDGGPFFSPDGRRICWRRFSPNGALAEIMTMNVDGSDQRQLTRLGAMSWAPYYHPSGEYLIFTTNRHGFANFELYLVDTEAKSPPVRVTYTGGFDGLPVFTPDGNRMAWTTNRTPSKQSQIFIADWNHDRARELLGLDALADDASTADATALGAASSQTTSSDFLPQDILRHVDYLCREELGGRMTGTRGEKLATAYVAAYFDGLGLKPAGDDGSWFQEFEFTSGVALGPHNALTAGDTGYEVDTDWRPVSFSESGKVPASPIVFAGYGIAAPKTDDQEEYDSFVHLDVKDKWVLAFRFLPGNIMAERRQELARYSDLRYKAMLARDRGARGLIVVSGPNSRVNDQLVKLRFDGSLAGTSIPVISVSDEVAAKWLAANEKDLKEQQDKLDTGRPMMGFELKMVKLAASIDIERIKKIGRNVIGRLQFSDAPSKEVIVVGAHIDHLGKGPSSGSLARADESDGVHFGADDNASGVAATLEVAEYLATQHRDGKLKSRRDILFAAWSGEELGLYGSNHFVKTYVQDGPLYPSISACINMDMVGRLEKKLVVQGVGSSSIWRSEIERRNAPVGLPITIQEDSYLPTDASSFYTKGVPILSAFTGSHTDYHTPRDTPDKLNYEGAAKVAHFMGLIARSLATRDDAPDYIVSAAPKPGERRGALRAYLGTIPDYAEEVKGVLLSGAVKGGPAEKAGIKPGDIIIELAGRKIENIYDYTYAIEALKIGDKVTIVVQRKDKQVKMQITPGSRD